MTDEVTDESVPDKSSSITESDESSNVVSNRDETSEWETNMHSIFEGNYLKFPEFAQDVVKFLHQDLKDGDKPVDVAQKMAHRGMIILEKASEFAKKQESSEITGPSAWRDILMLFIGYYFIRYRVLCLICFKFLSSETIQYQKMTPLYKQMVNGMFMVVICSFLFVERNNTDNVL